MNRIQKKLMEFHHGYFLAIGFVTAMAGFSSLYIQGLNSFGAAEAATVLGALILGYGTGRCDQKSCGT